MAELISVASRVHTDVRIPEPGPAPAVAPQAPASSAPGMMPDPTPVAPAVPVGDVAPRRSVVINGASHPSAVNGVGITRGVDAAIFRAWHSAMKKAGDAMHELMFEVDDDYKGDDAAEFGFEPGIEKMTAANEGEAEKGSTVTEPGPVSAEDMDATSENPAGLETVPPDQIPNTVETVAPGATSDVETKAGSVEPGVVKTEDLHEPK